MSEPLTTPLQTKDVIDAAAAAPVASNPGTAEKTETQATAIATAGSQELSKAPATNTVTIALTPEQVDAVSKQSAQGKTEEAEKVVTEQSTAAAAAAAGTTTFTAKVPQGGITTIATTQPAATKAEQVETAQTSGTLAI